MIITRIFPVNLTVYNEHPRKNTTGLIHSNEQLQEVVEILTKANVYYALSYREEKTYLLTHAQNNPETTTDNQQIPTN